MARSGIRLYRGSGGTGRRTSLRGWRSQERGGSNPPFRTKSDRGPVLRAFLVVDRPSQRTGQRFGYGAGVASRQVAPQLDISVRSPLVPVGSGTPQEDQGTLRVDQVRSDERRWRCTERCPLNHRPPARHETCADTSCGGVLASGSIVRPISRGRSRGSVMASQARSGLRRCHVLLVVLLASLGCSKATPPGALEPQMTVEPRPAAQSPGPPTTIRLVLQLQQDGTFRMISAEPRRGEVTPDPSVDDNRPALAEGRARLVEYSARNAAGQVVSTGRFIVPLVAVSEFQDPNASTRIRHSEERLTTPTIRVAVHIRPRLPRSPSTAWSQAPAPSRGSGSGRRWARSRWRSLPRTSSPSRRIRRCSS